MSVSTLGSEVTFLALPLVAILVLKASSVEVAVLGAMPFVAFDGHKLRSGFGDPHEPSVEFPAIELTPLVR